MGRLRSAERKRGVDEFRALVASIMGTTYHDIHGETDLEAASPGVPSTPAVEGGPNWTFESVPPRSRARGMWTYRPDGAQEGAMFTYEQSPFVTAKDKRAAAVGFRVAKDKEEAAVGHYKRFPKGPVPITPVFDADGYCLGIIFFKYVVKQGVGRVAMSCRGGVLGGVGEAEQGGRTRRGSMWWRGEVWAGVESGGEVEAGGMDRGDEDVVQRGGREGKKNAKTASVSRFWCIKYTGHSRGHFPTEVVFDHDTPGADYYPHHADPDPTHQDANWTLESRPPRSPPRARGMWTYPDGDTRVFMYADDEHFENFCDPADEHFDASEQYERVSPNNRSSAVSPWVSPSASRPAAPPAFVGGPGRSPAGRFLLGSLGPPTKAGGAAAAPPAFVGGPSRPAAPPVFVGGPGRSPAGILVLPLPMEGRSPAGILALPLPAGILALPYVAEPEFLWALHSCIECYM